ncbi:tetratricopeptide repeat protein [Actinoallomurus acanthiterrae]
MRRRAVTGAAEPAESVVQHASVGPFGTIFQAGRDMVVYEAEAPYRLSWWPKPTGVPSAGQARAQPSRLLRASTAVVPFTGRGDELADLRAWRDGPVPQAVRLVHGVGGQGKSRLAGHVAEAWKEEGWPVLAAHHRRDPSAPATFEPEDLRTANRLLVIVDYAERWDSTDLLRLLADLGRPADATVRVLLLARPAGTWWQTLAHRIEADLEWESDSRALGPVEAGPAGRTRLVEIARDRFAALLNIPDSHLIEVPEVTAAHDESGQALAAHMAALAAVLAHDQRVPAPEGPVAVSTFLLNRERVHWQALHDRVDGPLTTNPDVMGQAVYTATLTGGLPHHDAVAALHRIGVESSQHPGQIVKDHALCYPPPAGRGAGVAVLRPLYPDRLGEDFIALTTPGHPYDHPGDPWAEGAAVRLLTPDGTPAWTRPALTVLIETARRWPHVADTQLYPLLRARPELVLQAGGAALASLATMPGVDLSLLETIEARLSHERDVDLDPAIAALTTRLAEHHLARAKSPAEQARTFAKLGTRLTNAGLYHDAVEADRRAVDAYRRLAEHNPAALVELSGALGNLGIALARLGRHAEALAPSREAVRIDRRSAAGGSRRNRDYLAASLNNLGNRLSELGHHVEALKAAQESVQIRRRLARDEPDAYRAALASSLDNLANRLSELGDHGKALEATEEAVSLYRRLAADNRAIYQGELGIAVDNLGVHLDRAGRHAEALPIAQEAVRVRRELAASNPAVFTSGLAGSLDNLAGVLGALGRHEECLAAVQEAVRLYRVVADANPGAAQRHLAAALWNLGTALRGVGRPEEAAEATGEALWLYPPLATAGPDTFPS